MRLIDADALKNHKFLTPDTVEAKKWLPEETKAYQQVWNDAIDAIIDNAPTVLHDNYSMGYQDGVKKVLSERPQGKWIEVKDKFAYATYYHWDCSVCKTQYGKTYNFCPNCGARMEAENE